MEEHAGRDTGQLVGRFGAQVLTAEKLRFGFFRWHLPLA
jgi:hypothetical protein